MSERIWGMSPEVMGQRISGLGSNTSLNTYDGPYPAGVPNPFGMRVHAYPTRYHGPIYTRPMFALPFMDRPYDFGVPSGTAGLGQETAPAEVMPEIIPGSTPASMGPGYVPPQEPRTAIECDAMFPSPAEVDSAEAFAAYVQNEACHERVKASKNSRRWLIGLGVAFIGGYWLGRR